MRSMCTRTQQPQSRQLLGINPDHPNHDRCHNFRFLFSPDVAFAWYVHGCCFTRHLFSPFAVLLKCLLHIVIIHLRLLSRPTGGLLWSNLLFDHDNEGKLKCRLQWLPVESHDCLAVRFIRQYCTGCTVNIFQCRECVYINRCYQ